MIYVCESGSVHEGGSAFAASTSLKAAWLTMRDARIAYAARMKQILPRDVTRLVDEMYWEHGCDYFIIRKFNDESTT